MFPDLELDSMTDFEGMREIVSWFRPRDRIEILSLVNNQVLKMSMSEPYAENPIAMKVFIDLNEFLKSILEEELVHLGDSVQWSYSEDLAKMDRRTVAEVELEYLRKHKPRRSESEKTDI
jgi:hypothetical protein